MLPVTHGNAVHAAAGPALHLILFAVSLLPFVIRMSGWLYLVAALVLGGVFLGYAWRIYRAYSDALARRTFRYSIVYLAAALRGASGRSLSVASPWRAATAASRSALQEHRYHRRGLGQTLELTDHNGKPRTPGGFSRQGGGRVLRLHALPGHLPDHASRRSRRRLSSSARTRSAFRSCSSPSTRSATRRKRWASTLRPSTRASSGCAATPPQPRRWRSEFKVYFEKSKTGDSYTVDHSAQSYVIDPQGRLRLWCATTASAHLRSAAGDGDLKVRLGGGGWTRQAEAGIAFFIFSRALPRSGGCARRRP